MEASKSSKERMKELARLKIIKQQQRLTDASSKKPRKRSKSTSVHDSTGPGVAPMKLIRRQSFPPNVPTAIVKTEPSPNASRSSASTANLSIAIAEVIKQESVSVKVAQMSLKEKSLNTTGGKIKFVPDPPPIPPNKMGYGRKSSFELRKHIDNKLGYQPRHHHRHAHQREREKEYLRYSGMIPNESSDSD